MTAAEIDALARTVPSEERPVPKSRLAGLGSFLGIYGGEHIAATEFVIGALLVTWGVRATELLLGLLVGNFLATLMYALVCAPIAVDTRLSLFAYLRKATGPWFQKAYSAAWGLTSICYAATMTAIAATSLRQAFGFPIQSAWYPTSAGCVALTLAFVAVTTFVAAYGFKGVARFSAICAPWMIVCFLCGACVALPLLTEATGFGDVGGPGGLLRLFNEQIFTGVPPDGGQHLTFWHVAAFAWMCNFAYHGGLNDMAIFRYAKRASYGWVGFFGMYVGHFFAWTCAGVMGATAAILLKTPLGALDSGAVTWQILGWIGLLAVVAAGWTTATPNIYRAALSFATFFPKASLRRLSFGVGAVIAAAACFPAMQRVDNLVTIVVFLLSPVGAICLVEHWLFPRLGLQRFWCLYRGLRINPAALAAWGVAGAFTVAMLATGALHKFFIFLPAFLLAGAAYLACAWFLGARRAVPEERRADVDAVEARLAALAEDEPPDAAGERQAPIARGSRIAAALVLAALALAAICVACGKLAPATFHVLALVLTPAYFFCLSRKIARMMIAAVAVLLALGHAPQISPAVSSIVPRFSPILSLFGALAVGKWLGWLMLLGVPVLVLALFKGRFFCWHLCPMGFISETAGRLNPWGKGLVRHVPKLNRVLALVVAATAACGYPLLIWLDPLCIFNGFFSVWREPFTWTAAVTGIGFVTVLALSLIAPNAWCHRLCPLGGLQEFVADLGRRIRQPKKPTAAPEPSALTAAAATRRAMLAIIPIAAARLGLKRAFGSAPRNVIRPPGADPDNFNALCARCGNCMRACPHKLIHPDVGESGLDGLFTPTVHLRSRNPDPEDDSYCFQDCVACTQVCPTGALRPLTVEEKHAQPIGLAVIDHQKCIAWAKHEYCAVCDEYCPYQAIKLVDQKGVNCPIVDADKCRGCGACEGGCAASPIAIVVRPLAPSPCGK